MLEYSIVIIFLVVGLMFYHSNARANRLSHIQWVICAIRQRRDLLEQIGQKAEAARATELADALSTGCGTISLKCTISDKEKIAAGKAILEASSDNYLNLIGVSPHAVNYLPTKGALYWLGKKMMLR